jgi:hypothetical protein
LSIHKSAWINVFRQDFVPVPESGGAGIGCPVAPCVRAFPDSEAHDGARYLVTLPEEAVPFCFLKEGVQAGILHRIHRKGLRTVSTLLLRG